MSPTEIAVTLAESVRAQLPAGVNLAGIEVQVGEALDLDRDALVAAIQAELPGITVQLSVVEGLYRCMDCGAEFPLDEHPCPVCGSARAELVHGAELQVVRAWAHAAG